MHRSGVVLLFAATNVLVWCGFGSAAQTPEEESHVSFYMGGPAGIRRLRPETWGLLGVNVVNAGDRPAELLATLYFAEEANLQYARRLWVPARSRRYSWCPVFAPPSAPPPTPDGREVPAKAEVNSLLFDLSAGKEVLVRDRSERVLESGLVPIHHSRMITAVVSDSGADGEAQATDKAVFEMVAAARQSAGYSDAYADLFEDFFPPIVASLDGLDQLVLASDRLASDPAALTAVRRWLIGGGRLWVMLDQVDPATIELLLGDAARVRVVDRVGLTEVGMERIDPDAGRSLGEARQFEQPVDLVRVLAADVELTQAVNGWPAAFWQEVGQGSVVWTTLGPRAWVRPRTADDPRPSQQLGASPWAATRALEHLAGRFFKASEAPAVEPRQLEPYLSEQIGYRIAGRGPVAGILGGFCLVLLGSGVWLARKRQLERMAWVGPLTAALAGAALVTMGLGARNTVPPTVAVAQLAEVDPEVDDVHLTGLMAMYHQEASAGPLGARRGGIFSPDMTGLGGRTRRMVRTDLDAWHWEHLELPAGVRTAPFAFAARMDRRVEARAAFGPQGLRGTVSSGPFQQPADAVIALPWRGRLAAELDDEGRFTAGTADVLAPGQFITGAMLSDEQRRRQAVYEQLLSEAGPGKHPGRPTLFAWAPPLDMHLRFPEDLRQVGSALVAIPLKIEQTPPGARVVIPSPFLDFRSVGGLGGKPSAAFSNSVREWIEMRTPSTVFLRFQVPRQVLPIALDRASLTIRVNAPSRELEVLGFQGREPVSLASKNGPVGDLKFDVTRSDVLELDDGGGLLLGIGIDRWQASSSKGDLRAPVGSAWKIEAVELEVSGTTLQPSE